MKIEFTNKADYDKFVGAGYEITRLQEQYNQATIRIKSEDTGKLLGALKGYDVKFISELPYTLEKHFKSILLKEHKNVQ